MEQKKEQLKKLIIDITKVEHDAIKTRASSNGMSIKKWVINAILEAAIKEDTR